MNDIDALFITRMEKQLKINSFKGDFNQWTPIQFDCLRTIELKVSELRKRILDPSEKGIDGIRESSADIGNYCMKMFGIAANQNTTK